MVNTTVIKAKCVAFTIHLLISVTVISLFLGYIWYYWFPGPLFVLENVWQALQILIPVDAILGPMLTLALYAPKKKNITFDLSVIAALQIVALIYGGMAIYSVRPAALVFGGDRFDVVTYKELRGKSLPTKRINDGLNEHPPKVYAIPPKNKSFSEDGVPYTSNVNNYASILKYKDAIVQKKLSLKQIHIKTEGDKRRFEAFKKSYQKQMDNIALFYLQGTTFQTIVIILDKKTLKTLGYINVDPWSQ